MGTSSMAEEVFMWILRVEQSFGGTSEHLEPACEVGVQIAVTVIVLALVVSYYALHFANVDENFGDTTPLIVAMVFDCISCFTLSSLVLNAPLQVALGESMGGRESALSAMKRDRTLHRLGYLYLPLYAVMVFGDVSFFLWLGWFSGGSETPPVVVAMLYVLGSLVSNAFLCFGLGYVSLVHNAFCAQLLELGRRIEFAMISSTGSEVEASGEEGKTNYGAVEDSEKPLLLPNLHHGSEPEAALPISVDSVSFEFGQLTQRAHILSEGFHLKVLVVIFAFATELSLQVRSGFVEHGDEYPVLPTIGLLAMFVGNATSLWVALYTMGRAVYISHEKLSYAVHSWAYHTQDPRTTTLANTLARFPVTFRADSFEFSTEFVNAASVVLLGFTGLLIGVKLPELE